MFDTEFNFKLIPVDFVDYVNKKSLESVCYSGFSGLFFIHIIHKGPQATKGFKNISKKEKITQFREI